MFETIVEYQKGRTKVKKLGFTIKAIVLDGRPGVRNLFNDVPVQMCHFHQKQIIQRHLTLRPKLPASIELKAIADTLVSATEDEFSTKLLTWHDKWDSFLKERTTDPITGRWHYTHKRTRAAFRSLKNNLPYLFAYLKYPELNIPNTTNSLDGSFSWLKQKVGIHRGMKKANRAKIIEYILNNQVQFFAIKPRLTTKKTLNNYQRLFFLYSGLHLLDLVPLFYLAERQGFEPWITLRRYLFSKQAHQTDYATSP